MTDTFAVRAEGLRKRYGDMYALDGVDLAVDTGTVHAILGPNGAGKTTAVRVLATLLDFDDGRAEVAGYDVARQPDDVRTRIGLTGQYAAVDEILSGRQNLVMFGRLFHLSAKKAKRRADDLLEQFDLTGAASKSAGQYSGGMRRRLDLAASLILAPEVLFLDEPSTGLDPRSRNDVWESVRALVADGTTVVLTTQYLEEADHLADRICVFDAGRVVADGTSDQLKSKIGGDRIEVVVRETADIATARDVLDQVCAADVDVDAGLRRLSAPVSDRVGMLTEVAQRLRQLGVPADDLGIRRPTLDEAFLHLTGHRTEQEVAA